MTMAKITHAPLPGLNDPMWGGPPISSTPGGPPRPAPKPPEPEKAPEPEPTPPEPGPIVREWTPPDPSTPRPARIIDGHGGPLNGPPIELERKP
jgi:hypothetical protein